MNIMRSCVSWRFWIIKNYDFFSCVRKNQTACNPAGPPPNIPTSTCSSPCILSSTILFCQDLLVIELLIVDGRINRNDFCASSSGNKNSYGLYNFL
jgi:hypothetical protein